MKASRIVITQSSANYRKEETIDNKMTYPLPPISTVIGALHNACGYKEYKEMDISIQGKFESMSKEPYTDYCFYNYLMDDRGILVKMKNGNLLSSAFDKVASAKKSQGNDFRKGVTIQVYNEELLKEYRDLKDLKDKIDNYKSTDYKIKLETIKTEKKQLADAKKKLDKKSSEFIELTEKAKELRSKEKELKESLKSYEAEHYTIPISRFRSLVTSLKYYEVLNNIELILHVRADENILNDIKDNIYNLKSIGRSEDFVNVEEIKIIELREFNVYRAKSNYSAYINYNDVKNRNIAFENVDYGRAITGTKYWLNKRYELENGKRYFKEKKKVIYASQYIIKKTSENIFIDNEDGKEYIVNFI